MSPRGLRRAGEIEGVRQATGNVPVSQRASQADILSFKTRMVVPALSRAVTRWDIENCYIFFCPVTSLWVFHQYVERSPVCGSHGLQIEFESEPWHWLPLARHLFSSATLIVLSLLGLGGPRFPLFYFSVYFTSILYSLITPIFMYPSKNVS